MIKMKRTILIISLAVFLMFCGSGLTRAQEQPKPQKDTVNIDTDAKPTFYYAVEDEKTEGETGKSSVPTIAIIIGALVVVTGVAFLLFKRKK